MSADTKAGYRSVTITVPQPMEDDGITPRTDLVGLKVWGSNTSGFTPSESNLLFYGRGLSCTIEKMPPGVPAYFKWALISEIEPDNFIISPEITVTPLETPNSISVQDGVIQGIGGGGNGAYVDNSFIDPGIKWGTGGSSYILASGRTVKTTPQFPSGGSATAAAYTSVGMCFSFHVRHTSGRWRASIHAIFPGLGIDIGIDATGFYAQSSTIYRPADTASLLEVSGGFFRVESYLDEYRVYSAASHQPLVTFPHGIVANGNSEDDWVGQIIGVDLFSQDARIDGIQIIPQRDKVSYGSMQPGSVQNSAIKTLAAESGKFLKAGSSDNSASFSNVLFSDISNIPYPASGAWFNGLPKIDSGGACDIGRHLDFHASASESDDYSTRISSASPGVLNCTGVFRVSNGSASAPAFSFSNEVNTGFFQRVGQLLSVSVTGSECFNFHPYFAGPGRDNTSSLGTGSTRWTTLFASSSTINTSDAREKTPIRLMSPAELAAAKDLAREIGVYQFLAAVAEKGADKARHHVGMTVQRVIEIMEGHGLDPMSYGFVCFDAWPEETIEHAAVYEQVLIPQHMDDFGNLLEARYVQGPVIADAWTETRPAGDRYSFRMDELLAFIARGLAFVAQGLDARLAAVEAKLGL